MVGQFILLLLSCYFIKLTTANELAQVVAAADFFIAQLKKCDIK
jgi:hypothetical protein